jgi:membrane protease YdiL (CAAX protease family)
VDCSIPSFAAFCIAAATMLSRADNSNRLLLVTFLFEGGLAAIALVVGWLTGFSPWFGMEGPAYDGAALSRDVLWGVFATGPAALLLLCEAEFGWLPIQRAKEQVTEVLGPLLLRARPWQLLVIAALAGLGEELLFRGLLQAGLTTLLGTYLSPTLALVLAIAIASVAFGLCHCLSLEYFVLATLAGAYFGLLMLVSGSLLPAILAHALYDFVAFQYLVAELQDQQRQQASEPAREEHRDLA